MWVTLFVTLFVGSLFHPRCLAVWVSVAAFFVLPAGTTLSVQRIALTQLRCDAVVLTRVARDGQRTRVTLGSLQLAFAIAACTSSSIFFSRAAGVVQPSLSNTFWSMARSRASSWAGMGLPRSAARVAMPRA